MQSVKSAFPKSNGLKSLLGHGAKPALSNAVIPCTVTQVSSMRATFGEKYPYKKAFPYEKKKFNFLHEALFLDRSLNRINENSKMIVVEGQVGVGKEEFAKQLAHNFDLKYIPRVSEDDLFVSKGGLDMRSFNDVLSEGAKTYDLSMFHSETNPESGRMGQLSIMYLIHKFYHYGKAMEHLLNTGQGVVTVQSPHADRVFTQTMVKMGWQNKTFLNYYNDFLDNALPGIWNPHLTIYLDASLDVVKQRISKSEDKREANSKVMTTKYLETMEHFYKKSFLPDMKKIGEVIEIDWNVPADKMDMDVICEEIQDLVLEPDNNEDIRFNDWIKLSDDKIGAHRRQLNSDTYMYSNVARALPFDCPSVMFNYSQAMERSNFIENHPAFQYKRGYSNEFSGGKKLSLF